MSVEEARGENDEAPGRIIVVNDLRRLAMTDGLYYHVWSPTFLDLNAFGISLGSITVCRGKALDRLGSRLIR